MARRASAPRRTPGDTGPLVLDSSCWLEFLTDTPRADLFAKALEAPERLVVPVITVYEVMKKLTRELGQEVSAWAVAMMRRSEVVDVDLPLCLAAATNGLPLADSLIYATAQARGATLWTQDAHFGGLPGVRHFPKTA